MKKIMALILTVATCISMTACDGGNKKAFEVSKSAYDNINSAYEITEQFGTDIYNAWHSSIFQEDKILSDGATYLATKLSLSEDELKEGVGYALAEMTGVDWEEQSDESRATITENTGSVFRLVKEDLGDNFFTFCVSVVSNTYIANGKVEEVKTALDAAKAQMKELSEKHSDYEHYPNLKGYYTTTSSFFDYCQNPAGSFEQSKETINDYKNKARDYKSDLDYIFEE